MLDVGLILLTAATAFAAYTYLLYPGILWLLGRNRNRPRAETPPTWPAVSIMLPVFNEKAQIRAELESLLALDYARERLQILVISDASDDGTDDIVREYADRGVELLRMRERGGKTAAENAARSHLRGEIIVNTDASIRIAPPSLKLLVAAFSDPTIGLVSGRDVSVGDLGSHQNAGESGYVGYEMGIRQLETRVAGIVGASGCFFGLRARLHHEVLPNALSRDFAAALMAREQGYRSVSADDAICYVARTATLRQEYRRKVRTIARGMETLAYKRHLLNPLRYGAFAWMLFSHKVCRWLVPWMGLLGLVGLGLVAASGELWAQVLLGAAALGVLIAATGWSWPAQRRLPAWVALPSFLVLGNLAAVHASLKALRGELNPVWDPTRRSVISSVAR